MRSGELIRIIAIIVLGAVLMFVVQPWLYESQILFLDTDPADWIANQYMPAAYLVGGVSIAATFAWYFLSAKARTLQAKGMDTWRLLWWIMFLAPILSIGGALAVFNQNKAALLVLGLLFTADVLWLFWLPTVTSSPEPSKFLPPGAFTIRRMIEPGP
jgi:hypothetical protein